MSIFILAKMEQIQCLQTIQNFDKVPTRGQLTSRFYPDALRQRARACILLALILTYLQLPVSVVVIANVISPVSSQTKFFCVFICGECRSGRPQVCD